MNAPIPDPSLIACHIDESAGMDPAVEGNGPATTAAIERAAETMHSRLYWVERITFAEAKATVAESLAAALDAVDLEDLIDEAMDDYGSSRMADLAIRTALLGEAATPNAQRVLATPTAPATPAVGVGTSEVGTGAQGGAGGLSLGDMLRHIADSEAAVLGGYVVAHLADRADALERDLARVNQIDAEGHDLMTLASENLTLAAQVEQWQDSAKYAVRQVERVRALVSMRGGMTAELVREALDGTQ